MPASFADGRSVLNAILFDFRGCLTAIVGHSTILLEHPSDLPADTLAWFSRWKPIVEKWRETEEEFRQYCYPEQDTVADWETVIAQLGDRLTDVPTAYGEAQELPMPDNERAKDDVSSVVRALARLCEFHRFLLTQEYKRFWAKYNSQDNAS